MVFFFFFPVEQMFKGIFVIVMTSLKLQKGKGKEKTHMTHALYSTRNIEYKSYGNVSFLFFSFQMKVTLQLSWKPFTMQSSIVFAKHSTSIYV